MKPLFSHRREKAKDYGLTNAEAQQFIKIPMQTPYYKNLLRDRYLLFKRALKEGWTRSAYERAVRHQYEVRGWATDAKKITKADIWKMLRDYERSWRDSASPDELDRWISPSSRTSHHSSSLDHSKLREAKRIYNNRPEVRERRRLYRLAHRPQIREAEAKRRRFNRENGIRSN